MTDSFDKSIKKSMVSDLLPEKPPKYQPSYGRRSYVASEWEESSDPFDYQYDDTYYSPQFLSAVKAKPATLEDEVEKVFKDAIYASSGVYLSTVKKEELVDIFAREFSKTLDDSGLFWSSQGSKMMRAYFSDLIEELYWGSDKIKVEDLEV